MGEIINCRLPNPLSLIDRSVGLTKLFEKRVSEKNRSNRLSQKIKPSNGAKSTTRIYHDEIMPLYTLATDSTLDPTKEQTIEIPQAPPYVLLWEKTKKHKDGKWDPEGEVKYDECKKLHEDQIQKHGIDSLSLKEAYVEVLKEKPGYHRGLGPGSVPPRKGVNGGESNQIRVELTAQLQQLQ